MLDTLLDKIATYNEALKAKIKKAMTYPAVPQVAVIVTAILLIFVVPQFESLFNNFGADLPALTQMVVDLSALHGNLLVCGIWCHRCGRGTEIMQAKQTLTEIRIYFLDHSLPKKHQLSVRLCERPRLPAMPVPCRPCSPPACRWWKR